MIAFKMSQMYSPIRISLADRPTRPRVFSFLVLSSCSTRGVPFSWLSGLFSPFRSVGLCPPLPPSRHGLRLIRSSPTEQSRFGDARRLPPDSPAGLPCSMSVDRGDKPPRGVWATWAGECRPLLVLLVFFSEEKPLVNHLGRLLTLSSSSVRRAFPRTPRGPPTTGLASRSFATTLPRRYRVPDIDNAPDVGRLAAI